MIAGGTDGSGDIQNRKKMKRCTWKLVIRRYEVRSQQVRESKDKAECRVLFPFFSWEGEERTAATGGGCGWGGRTER